MSYAEKLKDPRWQRVRLEVMQRDGFACRDCGDSENQLTVHHCHYERGGPWMTPPELLMTVCMPCHKSRQEHEEKCHIALAKILAQYARDSLPSYVEVFLEVASKKDAEPFLMDALAVEWDADIRWWIYAGRNPNKTIQEAYDEVLGKKNNWKGGTF